MTKFHCIGLRKKRWKSSLKLSKNYLIRHLHKSKVSTTKLNILK